MPLTTLILLSLVLASAALWWRHRRGERRREAVSRLLDAADALEARLRAARAEIESIAGDDGEDPVRGAMQEMLRQRLWLQQHGAGASLRRLEAVRASIDAACARLERGLRQVERARAPLP